MKDDLEEEFFVEFQVIFRKTQHLSHNHLDDVSYIQNCYNKALFHLHQMSVPAVFCRVLQPYSTDLFSVTIHLIVLNL